MSRFEKPIVTVRGFQKVCKIELVPEQSLADFRQEIAYGLGVTAADCQVLSINDMNDGFPRIVGAAGDTEPEPLTVAGLRLKPGCVIVVAHPSAFDQPVRIPSFRSFGAATASVAPGSTSSTAASLASSVNSSFPHVSSNMNSPFDEPIIAAAIRQSLLDAQAQDNEARELELVLAMSRSASSSPANGQLTTSASSLPAPPLSNLPSSVGPSNCGSSPPACHHDAMDSDVNQSVFKPSAPLNSVIEIDGDDDPSDALASVMIQPTIGSSRRPDRIQGRVSRSNSDLSASFSSSSSFASQSSSSTSTKPSKSSLPRFVGLSSSSSSSSSSATTATSSSNTNRVKFSVVRSNDQSADPQSLVQNDIRSVLSLPRGKAPANSVQSRRAAPSSSSSTSASARAVSSSSSTSSSFSGLTDDEIAELIASGVDPNELFPDESASSSSSSSSSSFSLQFPPPPAIPVFNDLDEFPDMRVASMFGGFLLPPQPRFGGGFRMDHGGGGRRHPIGAEDDGDFGSEDYEALLRLDDAIEKIGFSDSQIDRLPVVTVKAEDIADGGRFSVSGEHSDCSICLSEYEAKDKLALLPCLCWFHVDCIRTWLRKNKTCPRDRQRLPLD